MMMSPRGWVVLAQSLAAAPLMMMSPRGWVVQTKEERFFKPDLKRCETTVFQEEGVASAFAPVF
jgi:hypothetical protein